MAVCARGGQGSGGHVSSTREADARPAPHGPGSRQTRRSLRGSRETKQGRTVLPGPHVACARCFPAPAWPVPAPLGVGRSRRLRPASRPRCRAPCVSPPAGGPALLSVLAPAAGASPWCPRAPLCLTRAWRPGPGLGSEEAARPVGMGSDADPGSAECTDGGRGSHRLAAGTHPQGRELRVPFPPLGKTRRAIWAPPRTVTEKSQGRTELRSWT